MDDKVELCVQMKTSIQLVFLGSVACLNVCKLVAPDLLLIILFSRRFFKMLFAGSHKIRLAMNIHKTRTLLMCCCVKIAKKPH